MERKVSEVHIQQAQYYVFKALKDCSKRCIKNYTKDLNSKETECLGNFDFIYIDCKKPAETMPPQLELLKLNGQEPGQIDLRCNRSILYLTDFMIYFAWLPAKILS